MNKKLTAKKYYHLKSGVRQHIKELRREVRNTERRKGYSEDFAAFVRVSQMRRTIGQLQFYVKFAEGLK